MIKRKYGILFILEDDYALTNKLDVIIPIIIRYSKTQIEISAYDSYMDTAREYFNLFENNDFLSDKSLDWLHERIGQKTYDYGYVPDENHKYEWHYIFTADKNTRINYDKILKSTKQLTLNDDEDKYLTETKLNLPDNLYDTYEYSAFGTFIDDKIVSVCSENSHYCDDDESEVGIETAPDYRCKGFAVSNLAAQTEFLLKKSISKIYYHCSRFNIASIKTAESAGYCNIGKNYYYYAYLK